MNDLHSISSEYQAWLLFIMLVALGFTLAKFFDRLFTDTKDTYRSGQIDALRGIIKYKLTRNKEGEEVWTEINSDIEKELRNTYKRRYPNVN